MDCILRSILPIAALLAAVGVTAVHADITVVSWGGVYTKSQQEAYGKGWEKRTGEAIRWVDYNGGLDEIRAQVESGDVRWDVVDVFAHEARIGCREGLFEPLPRDRFHPAPDGTPMDRELTVTPPNDCVVPNIIWSWLAFYDESRFPGEKPASIADFFDLERFPGRRGISVFPQANIEMALVADGVDPRRVYEIMDTAEGIDRAFAKLDTIRDQAAFWSSGIEPIEMVEDGRVVMSTAYNGRVGQAVLTQKASFVPIWDGQLLDVEWFVMVAGTPNRDQAIDFLVHASAPEQQAAQARWITYGPMRRSALAIIEASEPWFHTGVAVMPHMPNRAEVMPRTVVSDPRWWAEHGERIGKRYEAWMKR
ncbi:MAG: extracellular solute-binding protein [Gammaproteobacteria bacterium]|nr:extracellular solute-binding protein [Gammaproteobacteria bacterium]